MPSLKEEIIAKPITTLDEFEAEYKKGIGVEIELAELFATEATRDNIKNFAEAIGDNNPLWTDEEYAKKSRFGMITAPPTFLYSVNVGARPGLSGTITRPIQNPTRLYAGAEWEFFRPIWLGDKFTVKGKAVDIVRKQSKSLGSVLFATGEVSYFNQRKELLGRVRTAFCHFPIQNSVVVDHDETKPGMVAKSPDLLAFERKRRGAKPRYWEDVEVGMEMTPPLEKGVLTMTEILRFGLFVPPAPRRIESKRETLVLGFAGETTARSQGLADASDYGPQRISWLGQFVTDWMGDDGTLKKLSCQVRRPNMIGDISVSKGKVTRKYINNREYLVDCEIWVENQAGVVTAPGRTTVVLPSKGQI